MIYKAEFERKKLCRSGSQKEMLFKCWQRGSWQHESRTKQGMEIPPMSNNSQGFSPEPRKRAARWSSGGRQRQPLQELWHQVRKEQRNLSVAVHLNQLSDKEKSNMYMTVNDQEKNGACPVVLRFQEPLSQWIWKHACQSYRDTQEENWTESEVRTQGTGRKAALECRDILSKNGENIVLVGSEQYNVTRKEGPGRNLGNIAKRPRRLRYSVCTWFQNYSKK